MIVILPIITTPYLSRTLGANGMGIYGYTLSVVTYFILFGSLGISMYGQREIACVRDNKESTTKTFVEIFSLKIITMLISALIFFVTFAREDEYGIYYKIYLLEFLSNMVDITWFFQGIEEFKKIAIRNIIIKLLSIICIFAFVKSTDDLYLYIIIYCLSNLLGNGALWLKLSKYLSKINIQSINILRHLKPAIALFIPQIAIQIYTVIDKTMLGNMLGEMSVVGNYEQSQKIIKLALTIITTLGTVAAPRIAYNYFNGNKKEVIEYLKKSFNFVWLLGIPICLGLIAIAYNFIPWFLGKEYIDSILLIRLGAILVLIIGLNNVTGIQYLIPVKKQSAFTFSVVFAAILNFILNLILIPTYKAVGAMVSSIIAESSVLIIHLLFIRKDFDLKIIFNNSFNYAFAGIVMFLLVYVLGKFMTPNINTTVVQIFLGVLIYFVILMILKDDFCINILKKVKSKFQKNKQNC